MLTTILRLPLSVLEIFTSQKSFKKNPVIGSRLLNALGLHVFRLLLSRASFSLRRVFLRLGVPKEHRDAFARDGIIVVPDFVSPEDLSKIYQEIETAEGLEVRCLTEGTTNIYRVEMNGVMSPKLPTLANVLSGSLYRGLMRYVAGTRYLPPMMLERMAFSDDGQEAGIVDPQQTAHIDTFQSTMKSWLFLKDVDDDDGPFHFSFGSHAITGKRLAWEWRRSQEARGLNDGHSEHGSFRVDPEDYEPMGIEAPRPLKVKAGTLVVANTHGVHFRGAGKSGHERLEVFAPIRVSAFVPIPTIFPQTLLNIMYSVRRKRHLKLEAKARQKDHHTLSMATSDLIVPRQ